MTTFTIQDLNTSNINNLPTTTEEDEAMKELFEKMGQDLTGRVPVMNISDGGRTVQYTTPQHAPVPQPTLCEPTQTQPSQVSPEAVIDEMLYTIKQSLLLLSTVISQSKAQPNTTPPEGNPPSLQETIELTLQQADWFKSMVRETIVNEVSLEDVMKDIVKDEIESEVDSYFRNEFDPTYHFDFGDAVCSEVSDQLDDVVRDRLDEVVQEQLEEVVAEKLKSIRVVFD
jgi:hypothetical protein